MEDPSNDDVFSDLPTIDRSSVPDFVLGLKYQPSDVWHVRLNGIVRRIEVTVNNQDYAETGTGFSLIGRINVSDNDRLVFSGVYGEGLGRYFLGIQSTAGGAVNTADNTSE